MSYTPINLAKLTSDQRRCLRVVSEVPNCAHAARRLHWTQSALRSMLSELTSLFGSRHIDIAGAEVDMSVEFKASIKEADTFSVAKKFH